MILMKSSLFLLRLAPQWQLGCLLPIRRLVPVSFYHSLGNHHNTHVTKGWGFRPASLSVRACSGKRTRTCFLSVPGYLLPTCLIFDYQCLSLLTWSHLLGIGSQQRLYLLPSSKDTCISFESITLCRVGVSNSGQYSTLPSCFNLATNNSASGVKY